MTSTLTYYNKLIPTYQMGDYEHTLTACHQTLQFYKQLIGLETATIDTNIYRTYRPDKRAKDIYVIQPQTTIKVTDVANVYKYMKRQIAKVGVNVNTYGFQYIYKRDVYRAVIESVDGADYNVNDAIYVSKFLQQVIGRKTNIVINSNIVFHADDTDNEYNLDVADDRHELFGNADKKIDIDDVIDLFNGFQEQLDALDAKDVGRSFFFEGVSGPFVGNDVAVPHHVHWGS